MVICFSKKFFFSNEKWHLQLTYAIVCYAVPDKTAMCLRNTTENTEEMINKAPTPNLELPQIHTFKLIGNFITAGSDHPNFRCSYPHIQDQNPTSQVSFSNSFYWVILKQPYQKLRAKKQLR